MIDDLIGVIVKEIKNSIQEDKEGFLRHELLASYIKENEGKKIRNDDLKNLKQRFPEYNFSFSRYGTLSIDVTNVANDRSYSFHRICTRPRVFKLGQWDKVNSGFEYYDISNGKNAIDRIKQKENFINGEELIELRKNLTGIKAARELYYSFVAKLSVKCIIDRVINENGIRI